MIMMMVVVVVWESVCMEEEGLGVCVLGGGGLGRESPCHQK